VRPGHVRSKMTTGVKDPPLAPGADQVAEDILQVLTDRSPVIWSPSILRYVFFVLRHLPAPLWRKVTDAADH